MNQTVSHRDFLMKHLTNPAEAAAYLNAVAEDGEIKSLLKALRNVVEAQGGVGELAKKTKLSRTTLYKTLSSTGNPEVGTMDAILAVYGIRIGFFTVSPVRTGHRQPALRTGSSSAQYHAR
jgi:probable addiction module antidote protein